MSQPESRKKLAPIIAIFITVFLDLMSFGMFIPDLQLRGREITTKALGPNATDSSIGWIVGAMLASFSLAQLLTSTYLGRLSDKHGRRLVLLITCGLSVASYALYANADSLSVIFISRILSGIAAANLGVAFAYIADVTTSEDRAKGLGLIGAAFGLGFILGPVAGGLILKFSKDSPMWLGYIGAGLALINLVYVWFYLPESLAKPAETKSTLIGDLRTAFKSPQLGLLLLMFFAINIGFTNLETTYFQLLETDRWKFHLGNSAKEVGSYVLAVVGLTGVIMQGFLVRKLTPIYGEVKLLRWAYIGYVPVLAFIPFAPLWAPHILGAIALAACSGLSQPTISSLISRNSPRELQGGIFGITQSLGALARCLGPIMSNPLFNWKPYSPYLLGAGIIMFPAFAAWTLKQPKGGEDSEAFVVE